MFLSSCACVRKQFSLCFEILSAFFLYMFAFFPCYYCIFLFDFFCIQVIFLYYFVYCMSLFLLSVITYFRIIQYKKS